MNRVSLGSEYESDKDASDGFLIPVSPFLFGVATRLACGLQALRAHILVESLPTRFHFG